MQQSASHNDATKALEKMSELSRLGGTDVGRQSSSSNSNSTGGGRHSAWQSHWLNKGADSVKDVFKCVWCKLSFPTLESLTTHMKETQHMAGHGPHSATNSSTSTTQSQSQQQTQQQINHQHNLHQTQKAANAAAAAAQNKADLNLMIKETMPLPRKLVRGQDVWLGKGAEQTRQILKCMWCGQSFRSLSDMTTHMQQTQHYTNIISQEQIISWKSSDDTKGGPGGTTAPSAASGTGSSTTNTGSSAGANNRTENSGQSNQNANNSVGSGTSSTVSAVLTCKVCDQAFTSLKDLSNHMVKNAHYKEHIMRSISESGGRRRQTKEKRKKSLPVRKLLELERAQQDFKNGDIKHMQGNKNMRDVGRITCDKCGDKIDAVTFVEHIRQCVGGDVNSIHRNSLKLDQNSIIQPDSLLPLSMSGGRDGRQSIKDDSGTPNSRHISPNALSPISKDTNSTDTNSGPSVLNALEQLIEKSFDTRTRHGNNNAFAANAQQSSPLGSNILKRLGIDESVDYTKPLIDQQTMNFLRNYSQQQHQQNQHHHQQQHHLQHSTPYDHRRERSGSESSSVSDRGSSRMNSLTPEQKTGSSPLDLHSQHLERMTPRRVTPEHIPADSDTDDGHNKLIKKEPMDVNDESPARDSTDLSTLNIKKERQDLDDDSPSSVKEEHEADNLSKRRSSGLSSPTQSPRQPTPGGHLSTPMASPCSDRSPTPRLTDKMQSSQGSLGALSSMFDSLAGNSTTSTANETATVASGARKGNFHPLAALQKLCDKTENTPQRQGAGSNSTGSQPLLSTAAQSSGNSASGAIMAFSWACNDAVMNSDSVIKCKLCDTPFSTKGAYRHHLSKVHFVNEDDSSKQAQQSSAKQHQRSSPSSAHSPVAPRGSNAHHDSPGSGNGSTQMSPPPSQSPHQHHPSSQSVPAPSSTNHQQSPSAGTGAVFEESPHSKFLKYTELAKQLSSKYV